MDVHSSVTFSARLEEDNSSGPFSRSEMEKSKDKSSVIFPAKGAFVSLHQKVAEKTPSVVTILPTAGKLDRSEDNRMGFPNQCTMGE
jgi:hypothetical protein